MTQHHILGLDPGFGGFKLAEVTDSGCKPPISLRWWASATPTSACSPWTDWAVAATATRPARYPGTAPATWSAPTWPATPAGSSKRQRLPAPDARYQHVAS